MFHNPFFWIVWLGCWYLAGAGIALLIEWARGR